MILTPQGRQLLIIYLKVNRQVTPMDAIGLSVNINCEHCFVHEWNPCEKYNRTMELEEFM